MNRVAEKSPFKSARIFDCLRLLALEDVLRERRPAALTLHSSDRDLTEAVGALCAALNIQFAHEGGAARPHRGLYDSLPHSVRGLASFRHLALRWPFRTLRPVRWFSGKEAIFACSYFFHLDREARARGEFRPGQWGDLAAWLHQNGARTNWLHHFLPDLDEVRAALETLATFNRDAERQGRHAFIESYLTPANARRAMRLWLRTIRTARRLGDVSGAFRPRDSAAWLWPLLRDDWHNSISGTASVSNCVWHVLFDEALKDVPAQPRGIFLFEGQGWETAFVHAWRRHGHGEVIAVPHSSMPFWYLNIYDDPRTFSDQQPCRKPQADRWAVNGPMAWKALTSAGYPDARLAPVEALRYQYLIPIASRARDARRMQRSQTDPLRLLVLGDFTREQTLRMLEIVAGAARRHGVTMRVTVKLHPACRIDPSDVPDLDAAFTAEDAGSVAGGMDVAFSSNTTSAGLDALIAGLPLVVFLDDEVFNHSPLRGQPHVTFVSTADELIEAARAAMAVPQEARPESFFWLDERMPRWRALLLAGGNARG